MNGQLRRADLDQNPFECAPNGAFAKRAPVAIGADSKSGSSFALALQHVEKIGRHASTRRYASLDRGHMQTRAVELRPPHCHDVANALAGAEEQVEDQQVIRIAQRLEAFFTSP